MRFSICDTLTMVCDVSDQFFLNSKKYASTASAMAALVFDQL
ncbi:hypothetical protein 2019_scaffold260_00016 [Bacteriophage sp.]|nr:hypothetical protein 2019_scaffold260_00016 [Bacteriophage sp.]